MLNRTLDAYDGDLPDNVEVIFTNTGKERSETYDFIHRCSQEWNVDITWLEYDYDTDAMGTRKDPRHIHRVVDYVTASRLGEPFEKMVKAKRYLPNVYTRTCTEELKINTLERYLRRDKGITGHTSIIGFRYDERRRIAPNRNGVKKNMPTVRMFPLICDEVDEDDVMNFWSGQNFDLGIESYQGNCDLCFLKGRSKLLSLIKEDPARAQWWIGMENLNFGYQTDRRIKIRNPDILQFNKKYSVQDLVDYAELQPDLEFEPDDDFVDCSCTD